MLTYSSAEPPIARVDPGWFFVLAGVGLIAAAVIVPALDRLGEVRWQRDRALAVEANRLERVANYAAFADAIDRADPLLIESLAASQLNQIPQGRTLLVEPGSGPGTSASVFADLEPGPIRYPERRKVGSVLERWSTNPQTQPWLIFGGALCLMIGLMPAAGRRGGGVNPT